MELVVNSVLVATLIIAITLSLGAFVFSIWNFIELKAQKLSTHTVMPITSDTTMQKIEEELNKITGSAGQGDTRGLRDLYEVAGIDPQDLV